MKNSIYLVLMFVLFQCKPAQKVSDISNQKADYVSNSLIIYYDSTIGKQPLLQEVKAYGAVVKYDYNTLNGIAITIPADKKLTDAEKYFKKVKGVLQVNRDNIMSLD